MSLGTYDWRVTRGHVLMLSRASVNGDTPLAGIKRVTTAMALIAGYTTQLRAEAQRIRLGRSKDTGLKQIPFLSRLGHTNSPTGLCALMVGIEGVIPPTELITYIRGTLVRAVGEYKSNPRWLTEWE